MPVSRVSSHERSISGEPPFETQFASVPHTKIKIRQNRKFMVRALIFPYTYCFVVFQTSSAESVRNLKIFEKVSETFKKSETNMNESQRVVIIHRVLKILTEFRLEKKLYRV